MIDFIKREMTLGKVYDQVDECLLESVISQDVKDALLDSVEMDIDGVGAENDSELTNLLEIIPEFEEEDPSLEAELSTVIESVVETRL